MHPTGIAVMCSLACVVAGAMSPESVELQTRLLSGIYEAVKDRQMQEGELNLLKNESAGFASSVRSFSEKGAVTFYVA